MTAKQILHLVPMLLLLQATLISVPAQATPASPDATQDKWWDSDWPYRLRVEAAGSGVVEAGCKQIVGQRLKRSGMRWELDGMRSILYLRLAVLNGQWLVRQRRAA